MKIIITAVVKGEVSEDAQYDCEQAVKDTLKEWGFEAETEFRTEGV